MTRLPISARLTAAFALAMAVVLTATCAWVYERQGDGVGASTDRRLRDRQHAVVALAAEGDAPSASAPGREFVEADAGVVQVYDREGSLLASTAALGSARVVGRGRAAAATRGGRLFHVHAHADALHDARVLLFRTDDGRYTVALVESQVAAHEALERLAAQLAVGATFAVLLGSLLAFSLARAALRPVERLRTEAARGGVEDGEVVLPVPPARDEVARLAVTLNELLGRMRAATLHERRFVAEAGHELRTPLATIIAEIELALEEDPPPNVAATLESLHAEALRLAALAEQLLQLSTIAERTTVQPVDLAALVADRVRRARLIHPERDIRVGRTVTGRFLADPQGMQQALDNLVANAAAHGGRGVVVDLREAEEHLAVHVLDDGPGIDAETAARAFDRFARASEARARPGTGLGLSIVHAIATAHAGTAGIGPRTDGWPGTDAWFTLRAQPAADEA